MAKKELSLGTRIRAVRDSLGKNQTEFAGLLGVHQGTLSAWERDDEARRPSADMLFRIGSLCKNPADTLFFWERAGIKENAVGRAAEFIRGKRSAAPPKGSVIAVPPLLDKGPPVYVDASRVPNPAATVYVKRTAVVRRSPLAIGYSPSVVYVLDTTTTELAALWGALVLILSMGPDEDSPLAPPGGEYLGRFRSMFSEPEKSVRVWLKPIDAVYGEFTLARIVPKVGESGRAAEDRVRRNPPHLMGIAILGRVIAWYPGETVYKTD